MSLAREVAQHLNDELWVREAFEKMLENLTQVPTMQNSRSLDNWFKKNIGRPLHQGGADKTTLKNLRRTFRWVASAMLKLKRLPPIAVAVEPLAAMP